MNARTSNLPINSETGGFQHMSNIQLENEGVFIQRQNCDKETNKNGKSLIEFCKNLNLRILNGRKVGDLYMENLLAFPMVQALLIMELHQKVCFNSLVIFQSPDKRYILIIVKYL